MARPGEPDVPPIGSRPRRPPAADAGADRGVHPHRTWFRRTGRPPRDRRPRLSGARARLSRPTPRARPRRRGGSWPTGRRA
jgi:hypothetical protein